MLEANLIPTASGQITRAAHWITRKIPVLGAEYIGTRLIGRSAALRFYAGPCSDGWDWTECTKQFTKTRVQHHCAWIRKEKCQFCHKKGFTGLEAYIILGSKGLYGLRCPECWLIMECMEGPKLFQAEQLQRRKA